VFQKELADVEQEIQAVDEADDKHSRHLQQYRVSHVYLYEPDTHFKYLLLG
jgi:hypothetical protein